MATVRIAQEIRQEVRRKIESLFKTRIEAKYAELQNLDVAMQVFMRRITPAELEAAQKLNADVKWVPEISTLTVSLEYTGIDGAKMLEALDAVSKLADARKPKEKQNGP